MIRINLLPQKRRTTSATSELWLVAGLGLVLTEVVLGLVLYGSKQDLLAQQVNDNGAVRVQIDKLKSVAKDHESIKQRLATLEKREAAIEKLQKARTGPTAMLLEIAKIVTPGRGPTVDPMELSRLRRKDPEAIHNPQWDARRLSLVKLTETTRDVTIEGLARDSEDVSEVTRRLGLSSYFHDVSFLKAKRQGRPGGAALVAFKLAAKVDY